ncbi:hypothetical protein OHU26_35930 [Streptomyces sp. NBC_00069]
MDENDLRDAGSLGDGEEGEDAGDVQETLELAAGRVQVDGDACLVDPQDRRGTLSGYTAYARVLGKKIEIASSGDP